MDEPLEGVDYAVFDDIQGGFEFFHSYKMWLGCQKEFYITDKYKGKKLVQWGKPCIFICNEYPLTGKVDVPWLEGNCEIHEVTESLLMPIES